MWWISNLVEKLLIWRGAARLTQKDEDDRENGGGDEFHTSKKARWFGAARLTQEDEYDAGEDDGEDGGGVECDEF